MTDKELIKKLNSLKNLKPEASWKTSNRALLLSQIANSGARDLSPWQTFSINFNSFMKAIAQPAYALGIFVFVLLAGSLFSHQIFSETKPNDSLYIARIVSEKAKLSTVMNLEDRNKLAVHFALEHAQDISTMLADPNFNTEENKDQVAKLNESFNKEIDSAKNMISYLAPKSEPTASFEASSTQLNSEDDVFLIAGSEKNEQGLEVLEIETTVEITSPESYIEEDVLPEESSLVGEEEMVLMALPEISTSSSLLTDSILDEAKQLSENKDYQKVSEKLREVSELIK